MQKIPTGVILVIVTTVTVISAFATTLLVANRRLPNTGNLKAVGVGVYWDSDCTTNVTSIDWSSLEPGDEVNRTFYVKNEGNVPVMLNMTTENWSPPAASEDITVTWNLEGHVLDAGSVIQAILTLSVSPSIDGVTDFSFDVVITGTEHT